MTNIVSLIWPFLDFVYILQLEDYDTASYFKWVYTRFFKRQLQYVGKITWTKKAQAILSVALGLYLALIYFFWPVGVIYQLAVIVFFTCLIPLIVGLANLICSPIDLYIKQNTIKLAKAKLSQMPDCIVVAIAGSYGKSTVRYFANQLLNPDFAVHTPKENHNTMFSLAQDIVNELPVKTKYYLVELGEYNVGDFKRYIGLLDPEIVVVTAIGPQHLSSFGSQAAIDSEFNDLISITKNKIHLLNAENDGIKRVFGDDVAQIGQYNQQYLENNFNNVNADIMSIPQLKQCAAAAVVLASALGVSKETIQPHITLLHPVERRMDVTEQNGITIIDDTYNINPESAKAALSYLETLKGRKIIVTGGIVDQGQSSDNANIVFADQISQVCEIAIIAQTIYAPLIIDTIKDRNKLCRVIESPHPSRTPSILKEILQSGDNVLLQNELPDLYWH
ncbi:MAG: Mur ligase family protein [Patescibacteria group bacterium]|jgi:UDP-N-acetylmuramoyl-tripeptide--D-alanyl-D-alanine ligase